MKTTRAKSIVALTLTLIFGVGTVQAHLMVAQHGTLNFLDDSVYMVLSLPASAFSEADENDDGLLSLTEFSTHRSQLIEIVSGQVSLSTKGGKLTLSGLMVSPVTPHDDPKTPANQIIAMGRFSLENTDGELTFRVGLFGTQAEDQTLKITATRKSENNKQVFKLSTTKSSAKLNFN